VIAMDQAPACDLVQALRDEMAVLYEGLVMDAPDMPRAGPGELGPPAGTFLVGFDEEGVPVCCGGIKALTDDICEIKRMYVVPEARRTGLGRRLLSGLEQAARELGYAIARLDTGPRQGHAERMYRDAGYEPIGNFNDNPVATFFGEKVI